MQLQRIANYRVVTWGDERMRTQVERLWYDFIHDVKQNNPDATTTTGWASALRSWVDNARMEQIYYGNEANPVVTRMLPAELAPWCWQNPDNADP